MEIDDPQRASLAPEPKPSLVSRWWAWFTNPLPMIFTFLALATMASLVPRWHFLADLAANLRIQGILAIAVASFMAILARRWRLLSLGVALLITNASLVSMAIARVDSSQSGGNSIRVMSTNVLTSNQQHDDIVADIRAANPDIVAVIELSESLADRMIQEFASEYPHRLLRGENRGNFGIGILSRYPIESQRIHLSEIGLASLDVQANGYRVLATHPLPPIGQRNFTERNEHFDRIASIVATTLASTEGQNSDPPRTILVGDLNLTPWSSIFRDLERDSGLRRATCGHDLQPTWYAGVAWFLTGLAIDHALISDDLVCSDYQVGPFTGSDHRSITLEIGARSFVE